MIRRRNQPEPERRHPDPGMELKLERIRSLRRQVASREDLIAQYQDEIENQHNCMRARLMNDREVAARAHRDEIIRLEKAIGESERAIATMQEQVATLAAAIDDSDLAFL